MLCSRIHEHRDTAFYARQLCLASHYLSPLIRQASGESPSTWITKAVISEAKVLLKQSDKTILQISEELGFPNAPFFCRYFKRETGTTPSVITHTPRRTFICFALSSGIPPQVVMKWTGHSDYQAMKPYIEIAEKTKADAMKLFDEELKK